MFRQVGIFTTYNRAILRSDRHEGLDKSLLGLYGTMELIMLAKFVALADADRTTYAGGVTYASK